VSNPDPYRDLTTGVFHNRLGITDPSELARVEAELTTLRLIELRRRQLPGSYDLAHLQALHQHIFQDLYTWAGELRTVSIGKGHLFCLPQHLESSAGEVFERLASNDYLRGLDRDPFLDHLADLLGDLNALHPFREGNGRTQRAFITQLARDAGYTLRWQTMDPVENIEASKAAHQGDNNRLRTMLGTLTTAKFQPPAPRPPSDQA
jgi:cell filamentation protein